MSLPVAIQLYSVRDEAAQDFDGTLKAIADMGYSGVEFASTYGYSAAETKALLAKYSLVPVSAHVPLDDMNADPAGVVAFYKEIGCEYIAVPYLPEDRRPGTPGFLQTIEDIKVIGAQCKRQGIKLLYHNHDFEFTKLDGVYALDMIYSEVSEDLLATELDTCWVNVGGENPAEYIAKYSGRAPVVHLKDFVMQGRDKPAKLYELIGIEDDGATASEEAFAFRPVGYGVQDMPAIIDASVKAGAKWVVVEQDRPATGDTPINSAKLSREYLKSLGW